MKRNTKDNIAVFILVGISMVLITGTSGVHANNKDVQSAIQVTQASEQSSTNKIIQLTEIEKITLRNKTKNSVSHSKKSDSSSIKWEDYNINFW